MADRPPPPVCVTQHKRSHHAIFRNPGKYQSGFSSYKKLAEPWLRSDLRVHISYEFNIKSQGINSPWFILAHGLSSGLCHMRWQTRPDFTWQLFSIDEFSFEVQLFPHEISLDFDQYCSTFVVSLQEIARLQSLRPIYQYCYLRLVLSKRKIL